MPLPLPPLPENNSSGPKKVAKKPSQKPTSQMDRPQLKGMSGQPRSKSNSERPNIKKTSAGSPMSEESIRKQLSSSSPHNEPVKATTKRRRPQKREEPQIPQDEWRTDPRTGKRYKVIPKTEWDSERQGYSKIHLTEIDALDDLNSAASTYLSHLQVPPSREEIESMRRERAKRLKDQNAAVEKLQYLQEQEEAEELEKLEKELSKKRRRK